MALQADSNKDWQPISTAPFDCYLVAVISGDGVHALVFPCRQMVKAGKREWVEVQPAHWRHWRES
jgi:hypothetical protein